MPDLQADVLTAVNCVRGHKRQAPMAVFSPATRLRDDCGFDSMDLAELTVLIEEKFAVDIFADGPVRTVADVTAKLAENKK